MSRGEICSGGEISFGSGTGKRILHKQPGKIAFWDNFLYNKNLKQLKM